MKNYFIRPQPSERKEAPVLPPWTEPGWYSLVAEWLERELSAHGMSLSGPVQQFRVSSISCLLEVPTSAGDGFFKAVPALFRSETGMTERLGASYPQNLPSLIAVDHDRHWMLMRRLHGARLNEDADLEMWKRVVRRFSQIQSDFIGRTDELLRWGCLNRPLRSLPEEIDGLWGELEDSTKWKLYRVDEEMMRLLIPLGPQIKGWCDELAASGVPETLIHGDLHGSNLVIAGGHPIFFDWSDAAVSHPFFDMMILMDSVRAEWRQELKAAYLERWTTHLPTTHLAQAFELGMQVAHVYHALSYLRITQTLTPETKWEMADGVGLHLQKLLQRLGLCAAATDL